MELTIDQKIEGFEYCLDYLENKGARYLCNLLNDYLIEKSLYSLTLPSEKIQEMFNMKKPSHSKYLSWWVGSNKKSRIKYCQKQIIKLKKMKDA